MKPTKELIDAIERDRSRRAERAPPDVRAREEAHLYDFSCRIMLDGTRHQFPGISEGEAHRKLAERLEVSRRLEMLDDGR